MSGSTAAGGVSGRPEWLPVVLAVLRHPTLWWVALRQGVRAVPPRWWARGSRLPVPDPDYLRFRTKTSSGGDGRGAPDPDELLAWLRWSRSWPAVTR